MKITETNLKDCYVIEPTVFGDNRGFFMESFNQKKFNELTGTNYQFVQDNHSKSSQGVLRGLHYQTQNSQGKLVRVVTGEILDVAIDLRKNSPSFGKHFTIVLSAENKKQLWMPPGFAHGFSVLSESVDFLYKTTDYYYPEQECCIIWNDPTLNINWQLSEPPRLSEKDKKGIFFTEAPFYTNL